MRISGIILPVAVLLGVLTLAGCLYVPGPGGIHGSVDYAVTPAGTCFMPGMDIGPHGRTIVPAPGSYRRHR
jgi:hypothetical protein